MYTLLFVYSRLFCKLFRKDPKMPRKSTRKPTARDATEAEASSESALVRDCQEYFETDDLYKVMGIEDDKEDRIKLDQKDS